MIRNVIFDMGMVLLMYNPTMACMRHTGCQKEKAAALRREIFDGPDWVRLDGGFLTEDELIAGAQERLDSPELKALVPSVMEDWHLDSLWPYPGMEEVVRSLHQRGYRLYILSNAGVRFRAYQYKIPCVELFTDILVSAEEKMLKPDPKIFHHLCRKFGIAEEESLFIDDVSKNVEGAQAVGMKGYCFADGSVERLKDFLQTLA